MQLDYQEPIADYCDIRDVSERVGRAIMQVIALSHRIAFTTWNDGDGVEQPILSVSDLRNIRADVLDVTDDAAPCLARVGLQDVEIWAWYRFLNEQETATQVRPYGVAAGDPGMWVKQHLPGVAACATNRYLAHVEFCAAQLSNKQLWNRCRGKTPAVFVSPTGDDIEENSQTRAFHRAQLRYQIRAMSANWRAGVTARMKPPVKDYTIEDPGTMRTLGDIRRLFIHDNSLSHTVGVEHLSLGGLRNTFEKSAERIITDTMDVRAIVYTHTPNTPCEIVDPWRMWVQLQDELGKNAGPPFQVPGASNA